MIEKIKPWIQGKRVLLLGFGREGQSTYHVLRQVRGYEKLDIADVSSPASRPDEDGLWITGPDYQKCLDKRLTENDFVFAKDGSTGQKLDILERMMLIKKNVTMIGEFTDRGPKLYTEKAAGNICGCIGFVKDKNTKLNVPNTLLKKDIRDVTAQPTYKVFAVISKHYTDEKYTNLVKMDKSIDLKECCFSETIENMIDRENL